MRWAVTSVLFLAVAAVIAARVLRPGGQDVSERNSELTPGIPVSTTRASRREMEQSLDIIGVLRSESEVNISAKLPGRAMRIAVRTGDRVAMGQALLAIDDRDYRQQANQAEAALRAARANLSKARQGVPLKTAETFGQIAQAEENVRAAESNLRAAQLAEHLESKDVDSEIEKAKSGLRSAQAGLARAKRGARPEEIARAEAGVRQAEAGLVKAQRDFAAAEKLYKNGGLTRQDYEDAETGVTVAKEQLNDARAALDLARAGATQEEIVLAEEEVQRAETNLNLAKSTAVDRKRVATERVVAAQTQASQAKHGLALAKSAKAQLSLSRSDVEAAQGAADQAASGVALARQAVNAARIRSPVHGVVSSVSVHSGEMVFPGQTLMALTSTGNVFLEAVAPLRSLSMVHEGQEARVFVDSLPGRSFRGIVAEVVRVATSDNRSFKLHISVDNQGRTLTPGSFARGRVCIAHVPDALTIPREALLSLDEKGGGRSRGKLFTVEGDRARLQEVTLGIVSESRAQIVDGLRERDEIVISGAGSLHDGDRIARVEEK